MRGLNILYLGPISGTCLDRANALRRLGHQLVHLDLRTMLPKTGWVDRITWKLGGHLFAPLLMRKLPKYLDKQQFDIAYVDGGEWVTPSIINLLKKHARKVINYNIDDPLGGRDGARSQAYKMSMPDYDLCVVMREHNIAEARAFGAKKVLREFMAADEVSHAPRQLDHTDWQKWGSDVLFLGTWMPERGGFLLELIKRGVPLTIRGPQWHKAPEWQMLKPYWKGGALAGDDYAKAIQCAKVNIGLLSKGNRDLHTTRSLEIPALGGLLCAERTSEHTEMYSEGVEALFWSDAEECAKMCLYALADEQRRLEISNAGKMKIMHNGHYNQIILTKILSVFNEFNEAVSIS